MLHPLLLYRLHRNVHILDDLQTTLEVRSDLICFTDFFSTSLRDVQTEMGSVIVVELCCVVILKVTRNRRKYRVR